GSPGWPARSPAGDRPHDRFGGAVPRHPGSGPAGRGGGRPAAAQPGDDPAAQPACLPDPAPVVPAPGRRRTAPAAAHEPARRHRCRLARSRPGGAARARRRPRPAAGDPAAAPPAAADAAAVRPPGPAADGRPGPLWSTPEAVARVIVKGFDGKRAIVYGPWFWRYVMLVIRLLPQGVMAKVDL